MVEYELYELEAEEEMQKAISNYKNNLARINAGRANPNILSGIKVMYYDSLTPLNEIAGISVPEARQLLIKPFDASAIKEILKALNTSSLGLNGVNEGHQIRITFPEVTTQRRKELVKSLSTYAEQARVIIRTARQEVNKKIKNDEDLTEDEEKLYLANIQKVVDRFNGEVDKLTAEKEKELMTV